MTFCIFDLQTIQQYKYSFNPVEKLLKGHLSKGYFQLENLQVVISDSFVLKSRTSSNDIVLKALDKILSSRKLPILIIRLPFLYFTLYFVILLSTPLSCSYFVLSLVLLSPQTKSSLISVGNERLIYPVYTTIGLLTTLRVIGQLNNFC